MKIKTNNTKDQQSSVEFLKKWTKLTNSQTNEKNREKMQINKIQVKGGYYNRYH
jgi:hypothetical protein